MNSRKALGMMLGTLLVVFAAACEDRESTTAPMLEPAGELQSDVRAEGEGFALFGVLRYFNFTATLPNSVFWTQVVPVGGADVEIFARDCCIRDDVVEVYVGACLVAIIDSRNGGSGTHPGETHTVSLTAGSYSIEYRNVVSNVGPSGWYVSETNVPLTGDNWVCPADLAIDIKPGSWPNSIKTTNKGVIPVAILGSSVDVTTLDVTTFRFGPSGAEAAHDLTDPLVYADHMKDVDGDGYMDLVSHYRTQDTGIVPGDTEACLYAESALVGCDAVRAF